MKAKSHIIEILTWYTEAKDKHCITFFKAFTHLQNCPDILDYFHLILQYILVATWGIGAFEEIIFHIANTIHLPSAVHPPVETIPAKEGMT